MLSSSVPLWIGQRCRQLFTIMAKSVFLQLSFQTLGLAGGLSKPQALLIPLNIYFSVLEEPRSSFFSILLEVKFLAISSEQRDHQRPEVLVVFLLRMCADRIFQRFSDPYLTISEQPRGLTRRKSVLSQCSQEEHTVFSSLELICAQDPTLSPSVSPPWECGRPLFHSCQGDFKINFIIKTRYVTPQNVSLILQVAEENILSCLKRKGEV